MVINIIIGVVFALWVMSVVALVFCAVTLDDISKGLYGGDKNEDTHSV